MSAAGQQDGLPLEDASRTWSILAGRVELFVAAWESGGPPALAEFVPDQPLTLRRLVLVELIKVDLEYHWLQRKEPRRIEDYLAEFPELDEGGVPPALIYEEFHIRKQAGNPPAAQEYLERFPQQAEALARLLDLAPSDQSTTLVRQAPLDQVQAGQHMEGFDLLSLLGKGAFARVFLAWQRSLQRLVALKVSANQGAEPETLAQLDHHHIVRVFDQRVLPDCSLRLLYMEYVAGGTLHEVIGHARELPAAQRSGRLLFETVDQALKQRGESAPTDDQALRTRLTALRWPELVCWLGAGLADALDYAHRHGVLHRDIKPANVLVTANGVPKLADFNISFSSKIEGASPTAYFGGSLAYMSPEQLEACNPNHPRQPDSLDHRSDIYSLGVMLWELLTTSRPFRDDQLQTSWSNTLERMIDRRKAGPSQEMMASLPADCPASLKRTMLTCLAADPEQRFHSGRELARNLHLCLQPRAQALFFPAPSLWRGIVRRWPVLTVVVVAILPNALAALFNLAYNQEWIVEILGPAQHVFWNVQFIINAIAFPLGMAVIAMLTWPVARAVRRKEGSGVRGQGPEKESAFPDPSLRRRCLTLGHWIAMLSLSEWLLAGVAYPISIHAAGGPVGPEVYVHFILSLALCGLIAVAYPFFGITYLAVNVMYPALLQPTGEGGDDLPELMRLSRRTWVYMLLAASVPMLAVAALVWISVFTGSHNTFALGVLSGAGLIGFGLVFWLARGIQGDLEALSRALQPFHDVLE